MEIKLLDGGIYNIKNLKKTDDYCVVVKQGYDYVIVTYPSDYLYLKKVNSRDYMNELVYASAITNSINEDNFFKVSNFKKNEITGYLGSVDDECLKELRALTVAKFP